MKRVKHPKSTRAAALLAILSAVCACGLIDPGEPDGADADRSDSGDATDADGGGGGGATDGASGTNPDTGGTEGEDPPIDCVSLSQRECAEKQSCTRLIALSVDAERRCWAGPPVYQGCHPIGCDDSEAVVQSPNKELWLFSSLCFPEGWTQVKTVAPDECEPD